MPRPTVDDPKPDPSRCSVCGLPVAAWRVVRGEALFCTWACAQRARPAPANGHTEKRAPIDLANAERPAGDRPAPSPEPPSSERPWLGSAAGLVRALEADNERLQAEVSRLTVALVRAELPGVLARG